MTDDDGQISPRRRFLAGLFRGRVDRVPVGNPTSVATVELQHETDAFFPEAHLDGEKMARLASGGHDILEYDILRKRYGGRVAIIGKVMGPWTLSYHTHGLQEFLIKTILEPGVVRRFLDRLRQVTEVFGRAQIEAGVDALCLADHATGDLVSSKCYRDFLMPVHRELTAGLGCPVILHICGNTTDRLTYIVEAGFDAFHFDSKVDARRARAIVGDRMSLVGNINNPETLLNGTPDDVRREAYDALDAGVDVLGPECAVPLTTPNRNLRAVVEAARERARA